MGGVDLNDQLRGYYHLRLKCRKFYKYIFWFLIDIIITNTYILCRHFTDQKVISIKEFRVELAMALIGDYFSRKRPGRPSKTKPSKKFCQEHFPRHGAQTPHRCHYCQVHKQQRKRTLWHCPDCNLFLCHSGKEDDCFLQYHTNHGPTQNWTVSSNTHKYHVILSCHWIIYYTILYIIHCIAWRLPNTNQSMPKLFLDVISTNNNGQV